MIGNILDVKITLHLIFLYLRGEIIKLNNIQCILFKLVRLYNIISYEI